MSSSDELAYPSFGKFQLLKFQNLETSFSPKVSGTYSYIFSLFFTLIFVYFFELFFHLFVHLFFHFFFTYVFEAWWLCFVKIQACGGWGHWQRGGGSGLGKLEIARCRGSSVYKLRFWGPSINPNKDYVSLKPRSLLRSNQMKLRRGLIIVYD